MAMRIHPTLFIGLGTTGMNILEHLQQYLVEEYGDWDLPVLQFICLETNSQIKNTPLLDIKPICLNSLGAVKSRITSERMTGNISPRVQGYENWLPQEILDMNDDAFAPGANHKRAAGRLILWENWDDVTQRIIEAERACRLPANRQRTERQLRDHYSQNNVTIPDNVGALVGDNVTIRVVGSLCGGSCSGMFGDLGFLLRSLCPGVRRVLTAGMLSHQTSSPDAALIWASNCYAALKELDFYFQNLPPGTWSYRLEDGVATARCDAWPYDVVYLVSDNNGSHALDVNACNQMIAMDLFLDTVGNGRSAKDGALANVPEHSQIKTNARGQARWFKTFGLSAIRHPKSKISGIMACGLADDLCARWLGADTTFDPLVVASAAQKRWMKLSQDLEARLGGGIDEHKSLLEENEEEITTVEEKSNVIVDFSRQLRGVFVESDAPARTEKLKSVNSRIENLKEKCRTDLKKLIDDMLYGELQDCGKMSAFLEALRKTIEKDAASLPQPNATRPYPDLNVLDAYGRAAAAVRKDKWVLAVGLRSQATKGRRESYVRRYRQLWREATMSYIKSRKRIVFEYLLSSECWPRLVDSVNSLAEKVKVVKGRVGEIREKFQNLEQECQVIEPVFHSSGERAFDIDVNTNRDQVLQANKSPNAVSLNWHLLSDRCPDNLRTPAEFWLLDAESVSRRLVRNYQREGLRHLQAGANLVATAAGDSAKLTGLARAAQPYQVFNDDRDRRNSAPAAKDFVYAYDKQLAQRIGQNAGIGHAHADPTFLRHMAFMYREERSFAIDELGAFANLERKALSGQHSPLWTHKNPDFFNSRRFVNIERAEMCMVCSLMLFPDEVFDRMGENQYLFRIPRLGLYESFSPVAKADFERITKVTGALDLLLRKVESALRAHSNDKEAIYEKSRMKHAELEAAALAAKSVNDTEKLADIERKLHLLRKFNEEMIAKAYGSQ
jgi:hypothetical protein